MLQAVSIDSMGKTTVANPGDNGVQAFTQVPVEGYTVSTATDCEGKVVRSDTNLKFDSKATKISFLLLQDVFRDLSNLEPHLWMTREISG